MAKVKFLQDYRGILTDELFYELGAVAQLPDDQAAALVNAKRAEYVKAAPKRKRTPRKKAVAGDVA